MKLAHYACTGRAGGTIADGCGARWSAPVGVWQERCPGCTTPDGRPQFYFAWLNYAEIAEENGR